MGERRHSSVVPVGIPFSGVDEATGFADEARTRHLRRCSLVCGVVAALSTIVILAGQVVGDLRGLPDYLACIPYVYFFGAAGAVILGVAGARSERRPLAIAGIILDSVAMAAIVLFGVVMFFVAMGQSGGPY